MNADEAAPGEVERAVESMCASERALRAHLDGCSEIDPVVPSRLPGWSVGHVLTHLARNADSILSMLDGQPQYPHGRDGRNADIEAGVGRSWFDLVADLSDRSAAVERRVGDVADWEGVARTIVGDRPMGQVPHLRQREVEVHRVDLGLGHEFADMPADYVRRELRLMGMLWNARKPMGMTPVPDAALAVEPAERLSWMMGRSDIDGLPPADLYG